MAYRPTARTNGAASLAGFGDEAEFVLWPADVSDTERDGSTTGAQCTVMQT